MTTMSSWYDLYRTIDTIESNIGINKENGGFWILGIDEFLGKKPVLGDFRTAYCQSDVTTMTYESRTELNRKSLDLLIVFS